MYNFEVTWPCNCILPPAHTCVDIGVAFAYHRFMMTAADMAVATPNADVVTSIAHLIQTEISNDARLDLIVAVERQIAWLTAVQHRLVAQLRPSLIGVSSDDDWVQEELGAALRLAPTTAGVRLTIARALMHRLPATLNSLEAGDVSPTQATDIASATNHLDSLHAEIVEQRVLPEAAEQSAAQTRRAVKRAVLAIDPSGEIEREARAVEQRRVVLMPGADGMADLKAYLPAAGARALMTALRGVADKARTAGDNRTLDQRQADALVDLGFAVLASGTLPTHHGRPAHVGLTVTARTLSGEDDVPAELDGYGPISAGAARKLVARCTDAHDLSHAAISAYPVDASGQLQGAAPPGSGYRLPAALSRFVLARDRRCTFPHCSIPAIRCDLDHIVAFDAGGKTSAENLHPLCRRHHRAKHRAGWKVDRKQNGTYLWTAPNGSSYQTTPPPYPVDRQTTYTDADDAYFDAELDDPAISAFDSDISRADPYWTPWADSDAA